LGIRGGLQPSSVNFFETLKQLLDTQKSRYGLETQLSVIGDWQENPFTPETERQLLGIIQEALNNICKHAGVTQARLMLSQQDDQARIVIEDDGKGFPIDPLLGFSRTIGEPHFGLSIMRERAERVGGRLELHSTPGRGTKIIVWMPLERKSE
jgi:two-component system nitrate/nitrite sensor histidine kinase NarX